jgi:hypothetical protein
MKILYPSNKEIPLNVVFMWMDMVLFVCCDVFYFFNTSLFAVMFQLVVCPHLRSSHIQHVDIIDNT